MLCDTGVTEMDALARDLLITQVSIIIFIIKINMYNRDVYNIYVPVYNNNNNNNNKNHDDVPFATRSSYVCKSS